MASSREERMQQRLRGSQRRQVKDVDFGLTFPVVPAAIEEESLAIPTNPQIEVLPITQSGATTAIPSIVDTVEQPISEKRRRLRNKSGVFDANTSAKRRKLESDAPLSGQNTTAASALSVPDIFAIPDDDAGHALASRHNGEPPIDEAIPPPQREQSPELGSQELSLGIRNTLSPPVEMRETEQVTESPANAPGSGHRARLIEEPLQSNFTLQDVIISSPLLVKTTIPGPRRRSKRKEISASPLPEVSKRGGTILLSRQVEELQKSELDPSQPTRLHGGLRNFFEQPVLTANRTRRNTDNEDDENLAEVQAIDDRQAAAILGEHYNNRNRQAPYLAGSPDLDDSVQSTTRLTKQSRKRVHASQKPARKQQSREAGKTADRTAKKPTKRASVRTGSPIPVTVHRLTKRSHYNADRSEANNPSDEIAYASRPGVNAVDVLSQVCSEIVGSGLDTLENGRINAEDIDLKREYRTKWSALRSFSAELQSRLLSHTINLDNGYSLDKRVREEQKKKLILREEILRVRSEREQVALRMDEIRIKHESETQLAQDRDNLNSAAYEIELVVDRGRSARSAKAATMSGPEVLLKRIASKVSNKSDSGGILKQIKDFNSFLERAALALESKAG